MVSGGKSPGQRSFEATTCKFSLEEYLANSFIIGFLVWSFFPDSELGIFQFK